MRSLQRAFIAFLVIDIIVIASLCFVIFSGKMHEKEEPNEAAELVYELETEETDKPIYADAPYEEWKADVAKRLYKEFCEFYANMPNDDYPTPKSIEERADCYEQAENNGKTGYSRVMAADRACGILTVYGGYLSEDELNFVRSKVDEIHEKIYTFPLVYFTYTPSGLHIMTINSYYTTNSMNCVPLTNQIRAISDEGDFLYEANQEGNCWLLDVFAEDLSPDRENISIEPVLLREAEQAGKYNKSDRVGTVNDTCLDILEKYGRTCVTDEKISLESGSWNLFPFGVSEQPDYILIKCTDGTFVLNYYPSLKLENLSYSLKQVN